MPVRSARAQTSDTQFGIANTNPKLLPLFLATLICSDGRLCGYGPPRQVSSVDGGRKIAEMSGEAALDPRRHEGIRHGFRRVP